MPAKNNEIGRLFLAFQYPFEDDIPKQHQNILSMFVHISFFKTGSFACQDISEIGRSFSAFLYPFEDDILKQNQNILSKFCLPKTMKLADYFRHFNTLLRMTYQNNTEVCPCWNLRVTGFNSHYTLCCVQ